MVAIGRLRFLNLLNRAQNWHKSRKMSQKSLQRREKSRTRGFLR